MDPAKRRFRREIGARLFSVRKRAVQVAVAETGAEPNDSESDRPEAERDRPEEGGGKVENGVPV